jgi:hypothetical protein
MADHLASLSPDELAKWYRRLADFVSQQNQEACTKRQACVGDPLAPDMLLKTGNLQIHRLNRTQSSIPRKICNLTLIENDIIEILRPI